MRAQRRRDRHKSSLSTSGPTSFWRATSTGARGRTRAKPTRLSALLTVRAQGDRGHSGLTAEPPAEPKNLPIDEIHQTSIYQALNAFTNSGSDC